MGWHVTLAMLPGRLEAFRELTAEMVEFSSKEPGTLIYERFLTPDGATLHIFERYEDSAAAVAHLTGGLQGALERFAACTRRLHLSVLGSPTDELRALLDVTLPVGGAAAGGGGYHRRLAGTAPEPAHPAGHPATAAVSLHVLGTSWWARAGHQLAILPGQLEAFRELTAEMVEFSSKEPGTLIYVRLLPPRPPLHLMT